MVDSTNGKQTRMQTILAKLRCMRRLYGGPLKDALRALVRELEQDEVRRSEKRARRERSSAEYNEYIRARCKVVQRHCEECRPAGFITLNEGGKPYDPSCYHGQTTPTWYAGNGSRDRIFFLATERVPANYLLVLVPGMTSTYLRIAAEHFYVFGKDIGVPAYEKISRPEGFAIVLTAAGRKAARKAGLNGNNTALAIAGMERDHG